MPKVVKSRCRCGHRILLEDDVESYALLPERDYHELVLNEARLFQANDGLDDELVEENDDLFLSQSQRIGSLFVCPECGAIIVQRPDATGDGRTRYYVESD